ncbi:GIP [Symbiodinium sp. CCMP2456]|nr:GIP [Symbiodinium sp. CCMP2456]
MEAQQDAFLTERRDAKAVGILELPEVTLAPTACTPDEEASVTNEPTEAESSVITSKRPDVQLLALPPTYSHDPRVLRRMFFDDDLIDFGGLPGAAGADGNDDGDFVFQEDAVSGASSNPSVPTLDAFSEAPRRKRGSRGGSQRAASDKDAKRWRSGAIPPAPVFDGDIEKDPYCLRHYKRKLGRWLRITKEFLPPNEQALRALEQLRGEAELEFEEVDDARFDCPDGIDKLLKDLEVSFGERELFRQGGTIREFEQVCRLQGESVSAFIRRFRLLERKLKDNRVPPYPEQARVVKLLDGLRLDDKSVSAVLLAAGNEYNMNKVLEALRIQYPAGMTITGIPRARQDPRTSRGRGTSSSRSTTSTASTRSAASSRSSQSGRRWRQWNANVEDEDYEWYNPDAGEDETWDSLHDAVSNAPDAEADESGLPEIPEEEAEDHEETQLNEAEGWDEWPVSDSVGNALAEAAQALTVTSKKLAGLAQSRGFYQTKGAPSSSGKGKGKTGSPSSGKGKGKHGKPGSKGIGKSKGKGRGKLDAQSALQQQRLQGSLCLGCGSADHWLRDCPNFNVQNAQLASASMPGVCLDADGAVEIHSSWTTSSSKVDLAPPDVETLHAAVPSKKKVYFQCSVQSVGECGRCQGPSLAFEKGICYGCLLVDTWLSDLTSGAKSPFPGPQAVYHVTYQTSFTRQLLIAQVCWKLRQAQRNLLRMPREAPPQWLVRWRALLQGLLGFVNSVQQMVLLYSVTPDLVLRNYGVPSTATSVLSTVGAIAAQTALTNQSYMKKPDQCSHPSGLRAYGGGGTKVRICDVCGSRWVVMPNGNQVPATPKASPQAKTPLDLPERVVQALRRERESKKPKAKAASGSHQYDNEDLGAAYPASLRPSSTSWRGSVRAPPAAMAMRRSSPTRLTARAKPTAPPPPSQRRTWMGSPPASDTDRMSVDRRSAGTYDQDWANWEEPNFFMDNRDQLEGSEGSQFDPNDLIPDDEYILDQETRSPDEPLLPDDRGAFSVKPGMIKRVLGNQRAVRSMWLVEQEVYLNRARRARSMRNFRSDLLEIYGGNAEITAQALRVGLRALQPVDKVYGWELRRKSDYDQLENLVLRHRPYLLVYEIPCTAWSNIQPREELQVLRDQQDQAIKRMVHLIQKAKSTYGGHFLLENPAYTDFWKHPAVQRLRQVPDVSFQVGCMCAFNLKDASERPLKKPTGWMTDLPRVLERVALPCSCAPDAHGQVLGGNSQRAQVYTKELAEAVVRGVQESLAADGDERMNKATDENYATVYFLDINRHEDSWLPLLKEVDEQLKGKVRPDKVIPLSTPFGEQVKTLVPWKLERLQVCRTPMQRRLPLEVLQAGARHRGAALWLADGSVKLEAETVDSIMAQSANKFASPVRAAIFFFGSAPDSSLNPTENAKPEPSVKTAKPEEDKIDAPRLLLGGYFKYYVECTPIWGTQAQPRSCDTFRTQVCRRVQPPRQPRPAKPYNPQRFNDKLGLDVLWLKDIRGKVHAFLSQVDDATCYHVLNYLQDRSEEEVMKVLINGWMAFFGPPDSLVLDSDGCFRGYRFETLQAQCATQVRYVPADAHYQLGRTERHGQAIKYICQRLVSQFSPVGAQELSVIAAMSSFAKNNLLNRSGSSPCQWVYGRNHRLPGALLSSGGGIEACQIVSDSERLRRVEAIRAAAMKAYHDFEFHNSLRVALLRKPRPFRGPFFEGQRVAYYRQKNPMDGEGSIEGYRQGTVVAIDKGTLWLRNTRGRLVSCSREQVRDVAGEEEWWAPSQSDLDLLKKSDQDLSDKHSLAFRSEDVPGPSQDQAALDVLDSELQPSTLPVPEAPVPAPLPVLDAIGQPVSGGQVPLVAPLMLIPPTPRSAPGTPRTPRMKTKLRSVPEHDNVIHYHQRNKRLHQQDNVIHYLASFFYVRRHIWSTERLTSGLGGVARTTEEMEAESALYVKEREAMSQFFEDRDPSQPPEPHSEFVSEANLASAKTLPERSKSCLHRLEVLRRHGRHETRAPGWDGSPGELQPLFGQSCFLAAADKFGDHDDDRPAKVKVKSEELAKLLLERQDFRPAVCHQLLDTVDMPATQRTCLGSARPVSALALGLCAHGNFKGITRRSRDHRQLIRYLLSYMKSQGMDDQVTSLYLSRNGRAAMHRDNHNLAESLNWVSTVGDYTGGALWVESRSPEVPADAVWKNINGEKVPGFLMDPHGKALSFHPKCRHETQPFRGERYAITAYTSRSRAALEPELRRELRRLGFMKKSNISVYYVDETQLQNEEMDLDDVPVHQAYPLKAWQTPGEGEAAVMESSNSEGADGPGESVSRAQKQALKKELPWQAMSQAEIPKFVQALVDEWSEWQKWSSCRAGLMAILQWSSTNKVDLWNGDCQSAFLQGAPDDERPTSIFMKPPSDPVSKQAIPDWMRPDLLYRLSAPVYGQANAPRRWYIHVKKTLMDLGWIPHTLDPCLFLYVERVNDQDTVTAVLGLHVDDLILAALLGFNHHLDAVHASFTWGKAWDTRDFVFVGRRICQHEDYSITVDQSSYVSEVPITRTKLDPSESLSDHPELITEFRSGIGSLQWLSGTTRGDISADVSLLQKPPQELKVEDLQEINAVLRYVKATNGACFKVVPVPKEELMIVAYGDSGFGNAPNGKSQGGLVVVATSKRALESTQPASLLEWRSYRHQRVLRSTLAAEAASLDKAEDFGHYLAAMLSEMFEAGHYATMKAPLFEVLPVTDARSLWDAIHRLTTSFQEKRVEISIAALRQQCRNLRWVPTEQQIADVMTKRNKALRDHFREWMASPTVTLIESRSPEDAQLPGQANQPWRTGQINKEEC